MEENIIVLTKGLVGRATFQITFFQLIFKCNVVYIGPLRYMKHFNMVQQQCAQASAMKNGAFYLGKETKSKKAASTKVIVF